MSDYLFEHNPEAREFSRLRLIERATDAETIALLERAGIAPGWSCAEVGAGAGSIAEWLSARVGRAGRVIAIDKNVAYLGRLAGSSVQVLEGDFTRLPVEGPMDLVHARYVLIHNAHDRDLIRRMRAVLKPGGMVVLEEPDFTSADLLQPARDEAVARVNAAICRVFVNAGLDPGYGLKLPQRIAETGFEIVESNSRLHLCPGRAPIAEVMAESALVLKEEYTSTGLATDADIDHYVARARDPRWWTVYYATVSVVARAV